MIITITLRKQAFAELFIHVKNICGMINYQVVISHYAYIMYVI